MMRGPAATGGAALVREGRMSRRTFVSIAALVSLANAIPGLIAPEAIASLYGATVDRQTALLGQLLASSYIGFAVVNWTTRGSADVAVRQGVDAANLLAWAMSAVIWIYAASSGMTNAAGWFVVGLAVVFTIGWAYFLFVDRRSESPVITATPRG
jgi:hypothetical protein